MRIIIDGQKVPINLKVSRDLLIALKSIAKALRWQIRYDTAKEVVFINTDNDDHSLFPERPAHNLIEEPESNRLLGKVICLDAGHGGSDSGAIGLAQSMEKDNTLAIALLVKSQLENNGATVIMTRDTDQDVAYPGASTSEELGARVDIANEAGADLFISIHNDAFTDSNACGTTTFHYGDKDSINLASLIQKCLVQELETKDRGTRFASFYVIRYTNMPAVLVEVAFISNPEEELLLVSDEGRTKAADGIFRGITKFYKV